MADSTLHTAEDFEALEEEMKKDADNTDQDDQDDSDDVDDSTDDDKSVDDDKDDVARFGADAGALANMTMAEGAAAFAQLSAGAQGLAARARETLVPEDPDPPEPLVADDLLDPVAMKSKLDAMVETKLAPLQAQVTQANAVAAYQNAVNGSEVLSMYKTEVDAFARQLSHEQAADPRTWQAVENHLYKTRGAQIVSAQTKPKPAPALTETGKASAERGKGGSTKLTTQEKFIADNLGVSHKEYAALKPDFGGGA